MIQKIFCCKKNKLVFQTGKLAVLLFALCLLITPMLSVQAAQPAANTMLTADYYALPGFSSHMPIIVLDLQGDTAAKEQKGYFLDARILTFDNNDKNTLGAAPSLSQGVKIRNINDKTNARQGKNDYFLQFEDSKSILGFGSTKQYLLLGAQGDKSLIRNYVGYNLAAKIAEGTPGIKLCELFFRTPSGDLYQGVYSLVEKPAVADTVLFHRSVDGDGINIETYATRNDPKSGKMSIPFMETTLWNDRFNESIGKISYAEEVLYSTDSRTFYTSTKLFDSESFTAGFIIGELTGDYLGMYNVYYNYNTKTQVLANAPIWNFEKAFDNQILKPTAIDQIYYDEAPYYKQLFKSPQFAKQIQERYLLLRSSVLEESYLRQLVTDAAAYVEPAVQRDWGRWDSYRKYKLSPVTEIELKDDTTKVVEPFIRDAATYKEEILRLKHTLREHSLEMAVAITRFEFSEQEISKEIVLNSNPIWPICFLIAFFWLVRFARRYGV